MQMINCILSIASVVLTVKYMDFAFEKKENGLRRWILFAAGVFIFKKVSRKTLKREPLSKPAEEFEEDMSKMYEMGREINHWRHDMLGQLSVLYCMQKNGKYDEVELYLEKLCTDLKKCPELPQHTGNEAIDAVLMKAVGKCKEKDIHFCYVILGKTWKIDNLELGNLMNNLLNNAIEACEKVSGKKEIELTMRALESGIEIYLENSICESVLGHNPNFISKKKEKQQHGFGMKTIYAIVEKYHGTYQYWEEEKTFCQSVFLDYQER